MGYDGHYATLRLLDLLWLSVLLYWVWLRGRVAVAQWRAAPCELAPAVAGSRAHPRQWLRQGGAAVPAGDGGGLDRSREGAARGAALSGSTVAPATDCMKNGALAERRADRLPGMQMEGRKAGRGLEHPLRVPMTSGLLPRRETGRGHKPLSAAPKYATG